MNTEGMREITELEALNLFAKKKLVWIVDSKSAWIVRSEKDILLANGKLMVA